MWWHTGTAIFPSASVRALSCRLSLSISSDHPTHLAGISTVLEPAKGWCSKSKDGSSTAMKNAVFWFMGKKGAHSFWAIWHLNFQALCLSVIPRWLKYYSTCKDNKASVTESTITVELLMMHEYTRTKCAFSLVWPEIEFSVLYISLFYLVTLALRLPTVKHPNVEKNSSISFCRRLFLFSASSRARSEFLSFISSIVYFFRSWSSSSSNLSTCFFRSALVSSILKIKGEREEKNRFFKRLDKYCQ